MINFERYPHINELVCHYVSEMNDECVGNIVKSGVSTEEQAVLFSRFVWKMVERINEDEENGCIVLGSKDNTGMFPDLAYEMSKYMRQVGFYAVWESISESEI